ncbi:MAG: hypothetical protein M1818_005202 [Claussenomyces sp. TS43310]|nr:MAG: hypothetical protein M1818_005202 [Claussenomyces sp. TS43310]
MLEFARITAIDPAGPDYSNPRTLRQAQQVVSNAPLGKQITFKHADVESLISSLDCPPSTVFDAVIFCHSLWYFQNREMVDSVFKTLGEASIPAIYVADSSTGAISNSDQKAHQLAAQAQIIFYTLKAPDNVKKPSANIRAAPDKEFIIAATKSAGYEVSRQGIITPEPDYWEGHVEVWHVLSTFANQVRAKSLAPGREAEILSYVPFVQKEMDALNKKGIEYARSVEVWWAKFRLSSR